MTSHVVILAAGKSSRMGMPKGLALLPDGRTLLQYQLDQLAGHAVTLVVGAHAYDAPSGVRTVVNPHYERGPFSSLQCGLLPSTATFVLPLDVPCAPQVFAAIERGEACIPTYQGRGGHPVYLSAALVDRILAMPDGRLDHVIGPIAERVEVSAAEVVMNLNSPQAFAEAFPWLRPRSR